MDTESNDGTGEAGQHNGPLAPPDAAAILAAARERRRLALQAAEGLWRDRPDIPKDGVEVQERLRAEWP